MLIIVFNFKVKSLPALLVQPNYKNDIAFRSLTLSGILSMKNRWIAWEQTGTGWMLNVSIIVLLNWWKCNPQPPQHCAAAAVIGPRRQYVTCATAKVLFHCFKKRVLKLQKLFDLLLIKSINQDVKKEINQHSETAVS